MTAQQAAEHNARVARGKAAPEARAEPSAGVDLESKLHIQIMRFCDNQMPRWRYRHMRMDCASTESIAGAEDFTIFMPNGKTLHCECKKRDGKLDKDQVIWKFELERLGHDVHLVRTFDEFLAVIAG